MSAKSKTAAAAAAVTAAADIVSAAPATAPLALFQLAPENARHGVAYDPEGLAALAGSIVAFGRVLEPLKVYQADDGALMVWDGGRRLAALQLLAQDDTPPALLDRVAFTVTPRGEAGLASMATFLREPMHPADRFAAYSALFDAGQSPEQIAAACAVTPKGVAQLLRFKVLAPEVLEAFKAGRFDFECCLAFTLSTDHDAQRSVLASLGEAPPREFQIKRAFKTEGRGGDSFEAWLVGREAYQAAGGTFLLDLFGYSDAAEETWRDGTLLAQLGEAEMARKIAEVEAEGWASVEVVEYRHEVGRLCHRVAPADGEEFTAEERAGLRAYIVAQRHPEPALLYDRGWASHASEDDTARPAPAKPAQTDPARWGWGHAGHAAMTAAASLATRRALIANPAAAYDALVGHLAWEVLGHSGEPCSGLRIHGGAAQEAELDARDSWTARLMGDDGRHTMDRGEFYQAVFALGDDDKAQLLAFCFALSITATEAKIDNHDPRRWAQLGTIARHAGVTAADAFTPSPEFLKGGSRPALLTAVADLAPGQETARADAKKAGLVEYVGHKVTEAGGWCPLLIRDLLDTPAVEAKPKASKRRAKASPAPDTANDATDDAAAA